MKNIIITILAVLVLSLGGYLVYDKVIAEDKPNTNEIENNNENVNNTVDKEENNNNLISKYVGTYVGEKGTDSLTIKEDGTYEFVRTSADSDETRTSKGLVISNGVYIALVEFYDTYPDEMTPLLNSYHFYLNDLKLILFDEVGVTDSVNFIKSN